MCVVSMKEVCSRVRPDACMVGPSFSASKETAAPAMPSIFTRDSNSLQLVTVQHQASSYYTKYVFSEKQEPTLEYLITVEVFLTIKVSHSIHKLSIQIDTKIVGNHQIVLFCKRYETKFSILTVKKCCTFICYFRIGASKERDEL